MYVKKIAELTSFLVSAPRDIESFCRFLILETFQFLEPNAMYLAEIQNDANLLVKASFGFKQGYLDQVRLIPLNLHLPITESVIKNKYVSVSGYEAFLKSYPKISTLIDLDKDWKILLCMPLLPYGALSLVLNGSPKKDNEFESFLKVIGHLLILNLGNKNFVVNSEIESKRSNRVNELTERQKLICDLISKGHTNSHIAREIGYSESLIRQESMTIYAFYKISGRKELIERELG